jgi:succinate dehydrogenase / fumarate reductase membrane anchor subunit
MDNKTISNPHNHYGDAKAATRHFITQRISGALLAIYTIFFIWLVVSLAGAGRAEMVALVGNPIVAFLTGLMIVIVCVHMRIGMLEIIEDYVHDPRLNSLSILLNNFFALAVALVAIAALVKLAIGG